MKHKCAICELEIDNMDFLEGRVSNFKDKLVHSYCRVFSLGIIPECPISGDVNPLPQCNLCCVANQCEIIGKCGCKNQVCQIGISMRKLLKIE